jgi:short subunit dehydrogenase-like uncharacterized protein
MAMTGKSIQFMQAMRVLTPLLNFKWILRKVQKFVGGRATGPNLDERAQGKTFIWGHAISGDGKEVTMTMTTPEPYQLTVDSALKVVKIMLGDHNFRGALTPAMAFGAKFYDQLDGVRVEIES